MNQFEILKTISEKFPQNSKEKKVLRDAAWGLHFIEFQKLTKEFKKFIDTSNQPLGVEQKAYLKSIGIDTNQS